MEANKNLEVIESNEFSKGLRMLHEISGGLSLKEMDYLKEYITAPIVVNQFLNIDIRPGCGVINTINVMCDLENVKLISIRTPQLDRYDTIADLIDLTTLSKTKPTIFLLEDLNRCIIAVLEILLPFLKEHKDDNIKVITTNVINNQEGFHISDCSNIIEEVGKMKILSIV